VSATMATATAMKSPRSLKVSLFILIVLLAASPDAVARAEDWPGWRKDGSGVSTETDLPHHWGPEENVRWKTVIPGEGISSPIVWQNRVFVTAVAPGTSVHWAYRLYRIFLGVLTLAALAFSVEGTPSDPLGKQHSARYEGLALGYLARKMLRLMLFLGVAYAVLLACEQLRDAYPEAASRILGKPWEYNGHSSRQISVIRFWIGRQPGDNDRLEVNPQIPRDCFLAGFLGAFAVLGLNGFVASRARSAEAAPSATHLAARRGLVTWVEAVLVLVIASTFFIAVDTYALAEPPHAETTTWYQTANICMLGLIAAVGSIHRRSALRALGTGIVLVALAGLLVRSLASPTNAEWHEDVWATHFPVYWEVALVSCSAFCLEYLQSRRQAGPDALPAGLVTARSGAILLACVVFFVPVNYFVPTAAWLRQLVCIDRDSGATQWVTTCAAAASVTERWASAPETLATPSAVTDGEHVYVHFGGVGVFCVDFHGRVVWAYDDPVPPAHWAGSSPVLWRDLLVLTYDVEKRSFTLAFDKRTGAVRWEADRTPLIKLRNYFLLDAYSTPLVVQHQGKSQLVNHSNFYLCGYDLSTGNELWHVETPCGQIVPSPVVWKDLIIAPGGVSNKFLLALRLEEKDGRLHIQEVWKDNRQVPEIASPVVYGDYLYTVAPTGMATCRQAATNRILWKERLTGQCDASVTAADGKIFFCDIHGVTTVVAAGPEFRVLARNSLG
jgi:outer membrane protein assembly factor BamB